MDFASMWLIFMQRLWIYVVVYRVTQVVWHKVLWT